MKTANIGLIGCGARMHSLVSKIPGFGERIKVKRIYDPDPEAVTQMMMKLDESVIECSHYMDVIDDPEVDWIFIASWNCFHKEQVVAAANAGKHIFCEKPLATTFEDCLAIHESINRAGVKFILGFTLRYSPHYRFIKKFIDDGNIGDIISMEFNETLDFNHGGYIMGNWRRFKRNAGTHLLEKCCHDLDIANWIAGSLPRYVASFGGLDFFTPENSKRINEIGPDENGLPPYRTWRKTIKMDPFASDKDIVDNQVAIIEFQNGIRATFHTNCNSAIPERRLYVLGSKGTIRADIMAGTLEYRPIGHDKSIVDLSTGAKGGHGGGDKILGDEIFAAIHDNFVPATGTINGMAAAITAFGIDEAMETKQVVCLDEKWTMAGMINDR